MTPRANGIEKVVTEETVVGDSMLSILRMGRAPEMQCQRRVHCMLCSFHVLWI